MTSSLNGDNASVNETDCGVDVEGPDLGPYFAPTHEASQISLFAGSQPSVLQTVIIVLNICCTHRALNALCNG